MTFKRGTSIADALGQARADLDRIRAEVEQLRIEIEETERRPVDQDEVERRVDRAIAAMAARARSEMRAGYLLSPREVSTDFLKEAHLHPLEMAALIWPGPLRGALQSVALEAAAVLPDGISAADRATALAKLQGRLRQLEQTEVDRLWAIEDAGMHAPWRDDLPAVLVLGLEAVAQEQLA